MKDTFISYGLKDLLGWGAGKIKRVFSFVRKTSANIFKKWLHMSFWEEKNMKIFHMYNEDETEVEPKWDDMRTKRIICGLICSA